jgi:hypothetical protein
MKDNIQQAKDKAIEWYKTLPASTQVIGVSGLLQSVAFSLLNNMSGDHVSTQHATDSDESNQNPQTSSAFKLPTIPQIIISTIKLGAIDGIVKLSAQYLPSLSAITAYCNDKFGAENFISKSSTSIEKFSAYIGQYTEAIDPKAVAIIGLDVAANCLIKYLTNSTLKQMLTLTASDIATVVYNEFSKSNDTTEIPLDSDLVSDL